MEKKYESDMTPKEKRQFELEKMSSMTLFQKLEYLWTYYKIWLVVLIGVIFVLYLVVTAYQGFRSVDLLSIAVFDSDYTKEEQTKALEEDLLAAIGTGDKYEKVLIDASVTSGEDYTDVMKSSVVAMSGTTDLFVCSRDTYIQYEENEMFFDWEEILGEEYTEYEEYMSEGMLELSASPKWEEYMLTSYEPVYAGVLVNSKNADNVKKFVEFFFEGI